MNTKTTTQRLKQKMQQYLRKTVVLVKENGVGFMLYAAAADAFDELILPGIFLYLGHPFLAGVIGLGDLDWLTYPLYFVIKNKCNASFGRFFGGVLQ